MKLLLDEHDSGRGAGLGPPRVEVYFELEQRGGSLEPLLEGRHEGPMRTDEGGTQWQ